ncbi:hypothetical protein HHI36_018679 [Cryptolaemus montrouzieri]|uniref:Uncharacterized protein n=1 Tax=Cryptolaemus montrouzieri TaxID=559131 RepID=A0ABD2P0N5_9CUCU
MCLEVDTISTSQEYTEARKFEENVKKITDERMIANKIKKEEKLFLETNTLVCVKKTAMKRTARKQMAYRNISDRSEDGKDPILSDETVGDLLCISFK